MIGNYTGGINDYDYCFEKHGLTLSFVCFHVEILNTHVEKIREQNKTLVCVSVCVWWGSFNFYYKAHLVNNYF